MEFPNPNIIDIMAEVAEVRPTHIDMGHPTVIQNLARFAGSTDRLTNIGIRQADIDRTNERRSLVRLAAHAIARIDILDGRTAID